MFSRPDLKLRPPREVNVHVPRTDVVRPLDPLVLSELLLDNQVVPDYAKLLLAKEVRRSHEPNHLIRLQKVFRRHISSSHDALPKAPSATSNTEASGRLVKRPLLLMRRVIDQPEVRRHRTVNTIRCVTLLCHLFTSLVCR